MHFKTMSTITITFGDVAENHIGMQKIGKLAKKGIQFDELKSIEDHFKGMGCKTEMIHLNQLLETQKLSLPVDKRHNLETEDAYVLIVREGMKIVLNDEYQVLSDFLTNLEWDKNALMKGKIVEKRARYNLCFADFDQNPDIQHGKGTVINFDQTKQLTKLRLLFCKLLNKNEDEIVAEGNRYFDTKSCGINYHGDTERKIVIGTRFGSSMSLCYHWYVNDMRVGEKLQIQLNDGDIYFMSSKSVGNDWKTKAKIPTLRHSAGATKFTI